MADRLDDPILMLREIEAFLTFRLLAPGALLLESELREMKSDIAECLKRYDHQQEGSDA